MYFIFFFFNDTATTEIYTLSLHDALPISIQRSRGEPAAGSAQDRSLPRRLTGRRECRRECGVCRQIELIPADRIHAPAPWTAQRERMPARRRAVPAAGTGEVAITPVSWEAYRIAGAEHDGPAPRWDGDGFQQRARQRDRRSVHVEHDALVGDPNDAVPRAAAQPAIYVTLETSPLQLVGDCPMFRLWYRRPEDSPRSEEHTSELQSQSNLVCRLLLEKKKKN